MAELPLESEKNKVRGFWYFLVINILNKIAHASTRDNPHIIRVMCAGLCDYQNPSSMVALKVMSHPLFGGMARAHIGSLVGLQ